MALNLILALFWLMLAVTSLFYLVLHPGGGRIVLFGNDISAGWVAGVGLFMFGYNMLRWWLVRTHKRDREVMRQISDRARHRAEERNPDFDFSDEADDRNDKR
jgi:hypothetical protein